MRLTIAKSYNCDTHFRKKVAPKHTQPTVSVSSKIEKANIAHAHQGETKRHSKIPHRALLPSIPHTPKPYQKKGREPKRIIQQSVLSNIKYYSRGGEGHQATDIPSLLQITSDRCSKQACFFFFFLPTNQQQQVTKCELSSTKVAVLPLCSRANAASRAANHPLFERGQILSRLEKKYDEQRTKDG